MTPFDIDIELLEDIAHAAGEAALAEAAAHDLLITGLREGHTVTMPARDLIAAKISPVSREEANTGRSKGRTRNNQVA